MANAPRNMDIIFPPQTQGQKSSDKFCCDVLPMVIAQCRSFAACFQARAFSKLGNAKNVLFRVLEVLSYLWTELAGLFPLDTSLYAKLS